MESLPVGSQPGSSPQQSGASNALVIGIANYQHFPKLITPQADATAIEKVLKDRFGFTTKLLLDATRDQILGALDDLSGQLHDDDNLLIYYAGHGWSDKTTGEAYWIPVDGLENARSRWISAADITDEMKANPARHILVISDSCYSGMLAESRDVQPGVGMPSEHDVFLARMLAGRSRHIMSSGGNEPVQDTDSPSHDSSHSVFANALLQGLQQVSLQEFTARELFDEYVQGPVAGHSRQLPEYNLIRDSGHDSGDFVFDRALVLQLRNSGASAPGAPAASNAGGASGIASPSTPKRIRVGGQIEAAKVIFAPQPDYPQIAKMSRVQGTVRLAAVIDQDGNIKDLKLVSGPPLLVKAAMDAISKWRYQPTLLNGQPAEVDTEIDYNFTLQGK